MVCEYLHNTNLLSPDLGQKLRKKIVTKNNNRNKIILDFAGYDYMSSSFLNQALGYILINKKWSIREFKKNIKWINVNKDDKLDFDLALENARNKLRLIQNNIDPEKFFREHLPAC